MQIDIKNTIDLQNAECQEIKLSENTEHEVMMKPDHVPLNKWNPQIIQDEISKCLLRIEDMNQTVKQTEKLEDHFEKAATNRQQILEALSKLLSHFMEIKQAIYKQEANLVIIGQVVSFVHQILFDNDISTKSVIEQAVWIVEFESKVLCSMQLIMKSLMLPHDITTKNRIDYESTWSHVHRQVLEDKQKLKKNLQFTKKMLVITTSACIDEEKQRFAITKIAAFGLSYPQYFLSQNQGLLKSMIFYRQPTIKMASKIWNLPQNGAIRQLSKIHMKSIVTNLKIYIPLDEEADPKDITLYHPKSIQVRLLYNQNIEFKNKKKSKFGFCVSSSQPANDKNIQAIILHMHGGGFVALSSRSMQVYTRRWARDLKIPVFSVDYRMPPEHRFPTAPYDCLKVYKFLISKIHKYINVKPERIIIAGDSAGGNLTFSLTGLIMKQGLPIPHGIYAAYPATDLRKRFSPSKLFAFTDPLLNPAMLLLCLKQYLGENQQNQNDPLASPFLLSQQYIGGNKGDNRFPVKWPKTRIQVGAEDPLFDDSMKIMARMRQSNIDCECQIYENISHGFLNLEFSVPECKKTIKDSVIHLKDLLK